jgi:predicted membrane channel-forming protein YqfA (hemolysin III family)
MHLVTMAWLYVVLMMALAEATSKQGTVLGAIVTLVLYGLLPLGIVLYVMGTPGRKRAQTRALAARDETPHVVSSPASSPTPDSSGHAPSQAVAAERKEG